MPKANKFLGLLFSPILIAIISGSLALLAFALPESTYYHYIEEIKYVDQNVLIFVLCSVALFIVGFLVVPPTILLGNPVSRLENAAVRKDFIRIIHFLLGLIIIVNIYAVVYFFSNVGLSNYMTMYSEGKFTSAEIMRTYGESSAGFSWLLAAVSPIIILAYWVNWRYPRKILPLLLNSALILSIIKPLIRGDRGLVLGLVVSIVLTRMYYLYKNNRLSVRKLLITVIIILFGGVILFVIVQISRTGGTDNLTDYTLYQLFGYYIASFNRFGFEMQFHAPIPQSHGYYVLSVFSDLPILNKLLPLREWVGSMTGFDYNYVNQNTFSMWLAEGLDPNFNVITAFGYIYLDFGWLGVFFFLLYGFFAGIIYNSLKKEHIGGIMLYGSIMWGIIEWRGKLEITYYNFTSIVLVSLLIMAVLEFTSNKQKMIRPTVFTN